MSTKEELNAWLDRVMYTVDGQYITLSTRSLDELAEIAGRKDVEDPLAPVVDKLLEHKSVLGEAYDLITGDRANDYGTPLESFTRIAGLWGPVLGIPISPYEVALCLLQLKVSRLVGGHKRDSAVDIAGYIGCFDLMKIEEGGW